MEHHLIHTGAGKRCQRCGVNWDTGEEVDEICSAERDPNTDDLFDKVADAAVDAIIEHPVVKALSDTARDRKPGGYFTGGFLTPTDAQLYRPNPHLDREFVVSKEQALKLASRELAADLASIKNPAIKQGFTDLADQLRDPKPATMMTQVAGTHYSSMAIQPTEFCMKNGWDFCLGAILKYLSRYRVKNGIEDLKKARHFVEIRQGYAAHAHAPRCRLITMNTYIFENSVKREDSYALILLDEYAQSAGHHLPINADRLTVEIDRLIASQETLATHRQQYTG